MSSLAYAGRTDPGRRRSRNEDRWVADASMGLFVVADGVGGAGGGALAAQIVVDSLPALVRKHLRGVRSLHDAKAAERVREALALVNLEIRRESSKAKSLRGMGAAIVLALVWESEAMVMHLGDSRGYLFHDGELFRVTHDHSVVQRMIDAGEITEEEAVGHEAESILTRYLGLEDTVDPNVGVLELGPDDRLLLCSDGLPGMVNDTEIAGILGLALPPDQICTLLVDTANLLGGYDNTTVVVVKPHATPPGGSRPGTQRARP